VFLKCYIFGLRGGGGANGDPGGYTGSFQVLDKGVNTPLKVFPQGEARGVDVHERLALSAIKSGGGTLGRQGLGPGDDGQHCQYLEN
jgi:hypothetical protein